MEDKQIKEVVDQRTQYWDIQEVERQKICAFAKEVLAYAELRGIKFDQSAGITFVSHLGTLYQRLFITDEHIEIEQELFDQISAELLEMSVEISKIVQQHFQKQIDSSEMFLIATHLGSMKERIEQGITD